MSRELSFFITNKQLLSKTYSDDAWIGDDSTFYDSFTMSSIQAQCLAVIPDNKETVITLTHIKDMFKNVEEMRADINRDKAVYKKILQARNTSDDEIFKAAESLSEYDEDLACLAYTKTFIKQLETLVKAFNDKDNKLDLQVIGYMG
jgi:hypothetical protein